MEETQADRKEINIMDWEFGYQKGIELALTAVHTVNAHPEDYEKVLQILREAYEKSVARQMGNIEEMVLLENESADCL